MINFGKRTIDVLGTQVELDVNDGLPIVDISLDLDRVASQMAWWASVWASAERQKVEQEAVYRRWKSQALLDALGRNPKDAEWKIKLHVEGSEMFLNFQKAISIAVENVTLAQGVFKAYEKKANALQSRGAIDRGILERQGLTTPAAPKKRPSIPPPPSRGDPNEPPMFTADDDQPDEEMIPSKPRPSSDEMLAEVKRRALEKRNKGKVA